jgi:hypothetical protein
LRYMTCPSSLKSLLLHPAASPGTSSDKHFDWLRAGSLNHFAARAR